MIIVVDSVDGVTNPTDTPPTFLPGRASDNSQQEMGKEARPRGRVDGGRRVSRRYPPGFPNLDARKTQDARAQHNKDGGRGGGEGGRRGRRETANPKGGKRRARTKQRPKTQKR